ncbi:MAG: glycine cleavage system aminomethyltransferase GcvT, partial [Bdellovibrionales bacterium]|nr:glycine cleavage system aminomethyltransferase GcvT [Bdellovibrionales bacterium]
MSEANSGTLRRTALFEEHGKSGAKLVPFAGWEMPLQYSGVVEEHRVVREACGIFDVSHMGEIIVEGKEAQAALEYFTCNAVSKLVDGKAQYSALTTESGGIVDDIIIYRFSPERFLVCVNAANTARDFEWLTKKNTFQTEIRDESERFSQIAIQGPKARDLFYAVSGSDSLSSLKPFSFQEVEVCGGKAIVARTGYTGEDGFEVFLEWSAGPRLWSELVEAGAKPCGLGARDSLRLEACYPLHGHELSEDITAIESGLGWIVKPKEKGDFIGRAVLEKQKDQGAPRSLIGFFLNDPGIAR